MNGGARPPHAVLLRSPGSFAPAAVASVLAKRAGVPVLDRVGCVRQSWGVIAESLPVEEAEDLAAALCAAGQEALCAPTTLLEEVPDPVSATKAELSPEGFDLVSGRENAPPQRLCWSRLAAICAAALEVRQTRMVTETPPGELAARAVRLGLTLATSLPLIKKSATTKRAVETRDRRLVLDLLFLEPSRRVRVDAADFDYSVLGPRMAYGAELNFLALLEDLAGKAASALRGKGTRALLARRPSAESLYESLDDLKREERWLSTLAALRAAP